MTPSNRWRTLLLGKLTIQHHRAFNQLHNQQLLISLLRGRINQLNRLRLQLLFSIRLGTADALPFNLRKSALTYADSGFKRIDRLKALAAETHTALIKARVAQDQALINTGRLSIKMEALHRSLLNVRRRALAERLSVEESAGEELNSWRLYQRQTPGVPA